MHSLFQPRLLELDDLFINVFIHIRAGEDGSFNSKSQLKEIGSCVLNKCQTGNQVCRLYIATDDPETVDTVI